MKKSYLFLIAIIILGLFTTILTAYERINVESNNKTVEFVLDYHEIEKLANQSEKDLKWWFEKLNKLGALTVAISEETLDSLIKEEKDLKVEIFKNIKKDINWRDEYPKEFSIYADNNVDNYDVVAITKSKDTYEFIAEGLRKRYPEEFWHIINTEDEYIFILDGREDEAVYSQSKRIIDVEGEVVRAEKELYSSKLAYIGLGFDKEKIDLIQSTGMKVLPRPINYERFSDSLVEAFIDDITKYDIVPSALIFNGKEVLGYGEGMTKLYDFMRDNNISVGLVESVVQREHIEQEGIEDLTKWLNYDAVRTFSLWEYIQLRYKYYNYEGAEEIENALYRAITERNIRVVYFRPFKISDYEYVIDYQEYERTFNSLKDRLDRHGIALGSFSTMDYHRVSKTRLVLMGWGLIGFGLLFLIYLFKIHGWKQNIILLIGMFFVAGVTFFSKDIAEKILSLAASIIFPSLSILYLIRVCKRILISREKTMNIKWVMTKAITTLLICCSISLVGGLFIAAILSDSRYLLEVDIFRGVKLSQLLPIVIFIIIYLVEIGYNRELKENTDFQTYVKDTINLLNETVKIKYVLMGAIVLAAGYVYIARTGHETTVQPSDIEMITRNFLENVLLARPRTKEFLVAFPVLMICVLIATHKSKRLVFFSALAATIGQSSIINTFSHLRTPMYVSAVRTFYSTIFGVVLGIIVILGLIVFIHFIKPPKGANLNE